MIVLGENDNYVQVSDDTNLDGFDINSYIESRKLKAHDARDIAIKYFGRNNIFTKKDDDYYDFAIPNIYSSCISCLMQVYIQDDEYVLYSKGPVFLRMPAVKEILEKEPGSLIHRNNRVGINQYYETNIGEFIRFDSVFLKYYKSVDILLNELSEYKKLSSVLCSKAECEDLCSRIYNTICELYPEEEKKKPFVMECYPSLCSDDINYDYYYYELPDGVKLQVYKGKNHQVMECRNPFGGLCLGYEIGEDDVDPYMEILNKSKKFIKGIGHDNQATGIYYKSCGNICGYDGYHFMYRTENADDAEEFLRLLHRYIVEIKDKLSSSGKDVSGDIRMRY